ncbi:MAG: hypothetical protein IJ057_02495, partial [Bacteroidales bacterium]|nr:hypothetical protein [Bacteroidales bacterium]
PTIADPIQGGGLFQRGAVSDEAYHGNRDGNTPMLPNHGSITNEDASGSLGSGIAVLLGLGAAYLVGKKRREE